MAQPQIAIIGGGIGGIAAALALQSYGLTATVYEKSAQLREAGAGLMLWANATRALRKLNLLDPILEQAGETDSFLVRKSSGETLMTIATGGLDAPSICVSRSFLLKVLAGSLPDSQIRLNHQFQRLEQTENKVRCYFENGIVGEFDAVIGADGVHSRIRTELFGPAEPIYRGYKIWHGVTKYDGAVIVPGTNSETWGIGKRFGILQMNEKNFTWYATANSLENRINSIKTPKSEILRIFADWHRPIPELIEATNEDSIMENNAYDRHKLTNWSRGSVTLLGDAAHPCTPNLGQGGNLAIEDALVLAKCLANGTSIKSALQDYATLRRVRTAHIQQRARLMGRIGQWENNFVVAGRHLVTKLLPARLFEYNLRKTYSYQT